MSNDFIKRDDDPGYIVAWRDRSAHKAGKFGDQIMTYGEALAKSEQLKREQPERTFWSERASGDGANRFYNPEAH